MNRMPKFDYLKYSCHLLVDHILNIKLQFTKLIVNNEHLDDSQRLYYQKVALKSEANQLESANDSFNMLFQALFYR